LYKLEKIELREKSGFDLIDMIKECIEQLMNLNNSETASFNLKSSKNKYEEPENKIIQSNPDFLKNNQQQFFE